MGRERFRNKLNGEHRRQGRQRWQGRTEVMSGQTKLADMGRQAIIVARRMLDGVRPRRQLGEEEHDNEKETAQRKHLFSLSGLRYVQMAERHSVYLHQQAFEILAFGKVQRHRVIGRAS